MCEIPGQMTFDMLPEYEVEFISANTEENKNDDE